MTLTIGSLFSGYGGLDQGVAAVFDAVPIWHSDIKPAACTLLAHHYPDVPNLGDVSRVDWAHVERPDILTGGFPCTDISTAGKQAGLIRSGVGRTRSGLWAEMHRAIDELRPALVVAENVRALTSARADCNVERCPVCLGDTVTRPLRALGAVLADLADIGYDASWIGLSAADVGAPHRRFRIFIVAWPATGDADGRDGDGWEAAGLEGQTRPAARPAADTEGDPGRLVDGNDLPTRGQGPGGHGAAAVATGNGRHEGLAESARVGRRPDAAQRGADAAVADCARREGHECVAAGPQATEPDRGAQPAADADGDVVRVESVTIAGCSCAAGTLPGRPAAAEPVGSGRDGWPQDEGRGEVRRGAARRDRQTAADADSAGRRRVGWESPEQRDADRRDGTHRPGPGGQPATPAADAERGHAPGLAATGRADGAGAHGGAAGRSGARTQQLTLALEAPRHRAPIAAADQWGPYTDAIRRWEAVLGRPAPRPTTRGWSGGTNLSPWLTEWMMGLPEGWVVDVPGLTRVDKLSLCGDGVVPQQAAEALRRLLPTLPRT